jgi:hypothetical protein
MEEIQELIAYCNERSKQSNHLGPLVMVRCNGDYGNESNHRLVSDSNKNIIYEEIVIRGNWESTALVRVWIPHSDTVGNSVLHALDQLGSIFSKRSDEGNMKEYSVSKPWLIGLRILEKHTEDQREIYWGEDNGMTGIQYCFFKQIPSQSEFNNRQDSEQIKICFNELQIGSSEHSKELSALTAELPEREAFPTEIPHDVYERWADPSRQRWVIHLEDIFAVIASLLTNRYLSTNKSGRRKNRTEEDKVGDEFKIFKHLNACPIATKKQIADATGISPTHIGESNAWKANMRSKKDARAANRAKGRGGNLNLIDKLSR